MDYQWIEFRDGEYFFKGRGARPAEEIYAMFSAGKNASEWDALMGFDPGTMKEAMAWAKDHPVEVTQFLEGDPDSIDE